MSAQGLGSAASGAPDGDSESLADVQDVDVNYYVLVPFTTHAAAEWGAGQISTYFDCHVVSRAAVDQNAAVVTGGSDA